jgi:hypothetical protein
MKDGTTKMRPSMNVHSDSDADGELLDNAHGTYSAGYKISCLDGNVIAIVLDKEVFWAGELVVVLHDFREELTDPLWWWLGPPKKFGIQDQICQGVVRFNGSTRLEKTSTVGALGD